VINVRGLAKTFVLHNQGGVELLVLKDVDLDVEPGECVALHGPSGAGKSTLLKCLTGQFQPSAGRVLWRGRDVTGQAAFRIARLGIGIKTQVPALFDRITVREGIELAVRGQGAAAARRVAGAILERLGIGGLAERMVGLLAHGQRQLVELAMVIAPQPELIILDEPTAGMTARETQRTAELLQELNRDHAIVVVEHDMAFVRRIAGSVTVLHQGRVLIEGDVAQVLGDPLVQDIYLGRAAL
jgi:branched-chain amino acid transport system ATP-binding protein